MHVDGVARAPATQHVTCTRAMISARIECKTGETQKNFGGGEKIKFGREKDCAYQEKSSSFSTNVPMSKGPDPQGHTNTADVI